jgi:hypothetical protein
VAAPAKSNPAKKKGHHRGPRADAERRGKVPIRAATKTHAKKTLKAVQAPSRREVGRQLSRELLKLRPVLRDVGSALLDRLDGELVGLAAALAGESQHGELPALPEAAALSEMLAGIRTLKVKPKKGRVKDLGRIEALLEALNARMPPSA